MTVGQKRFLQQSHMQVRVLIQLASTMAHIRLQSSLSVATPNSILCLGLGYPATQLQTLTLSWCLNHGDDSLLGTVQTWATKHRMRECWLIRREVRPQIHIDHRGYGCEVANSHPVEIGRQLRIRAKGG